ncbi:MAG: hypothetical protein AAFW89_14515 [Bacteroidota bacterium]
MGFFKKNDKKGKPPHNWYPEILHWKRDDIVHCFNIAKAIGYMKANGRDLAKYMNGNNTSGYISSRFTFKSVDEKGMIYLVDHYNHIVEFEFWRFIKCSENETLKSRKIEQRANGSNEYMQLIQNFQQAFDELQEHDGHPKRLGEPKNELPEHNNDTET